ncbi:hypothetical protein QBC44DRAFT_238405 [Cladorrhinum sp. PSN332]|nr:hypothetical protein QBC44DRAFT_238405 [Cladorrhinum sp. PSN332]
MCFSSLSRGQSALLIGLSLVAATSASQAPPHGQVQKPLQWTTGCLPGPLVHASIPTCVVPSPSLSDLPDDEGNPWISPPHCADSTPYCVFTSTTFQGNSRGLSVITSKPSAKSNETSILPSIASIVSSKLSPPVNLPEVPPYEVRQIEDKGLGVVATRKIRRGKVFMLDYALVLADVQLPRKMKMAQGRELLQQAMARLPDPDRVLGLARSSPMPDETPVSEDVMRTNSFNVEIGGRGFMALFPDIARINHACKPSAMTKFNETDLSNAVTAFRDILPGEEITISYTAHNLPSPTRQARLKNQWGFKCTCQLCASSPSILAASDSRRSKIDKIGPKVLKLVDQGDFEKAINLNKELLDLLQEEGMIPHLGDYYEVMGRLYLAWAKTREARVWFNKALGEYKGFGVTEGLKELEGVVKSLSGSS